MRHQARVEAVVDGTTTAALVATAVAGHGATPGRALAGLRVVALEGGRAGPLRLTVRHLFPAARSLLVRRAARRLGLNRRRERLLRVSLAVVARTVRLRDPLRPVHGGPRGWHAPAGGRLLTSPSRSRTRPTPAGGQKPSPSPSPSAQDGTSSPTTRLPPPVSEQRMQLRGLHHVTAICADVGRTIAFYRDLLGLAVIHDGPSDDDPETRHVWFGAPEGSPGTLVSFLHYPELPKGVAGVGSTHHFAFSVQTAEEQEAWRDYLRGQGVECTEIFDRGAFRSIYMRDPDGHILEIATAGPGFAGTGGSLA